MAEEITTSYFLHAADLHLGTPLQSLGAQVSEEVRTEAKRLARQAFENLIDVAINRRVRFIVLAGDIYDSADRDPGARRRVLKGFRRLEDEGIQVFMAHGNHDPLTTAALGADLPTNVTVFSPDHVQQHSIELKNGVTVTIAGISYSRADESRRLVNDFAEVTGQSIIGVLHTNVGGTAEHGNYAPSSKEELEESPVHYWALGHIHTRQVNQTLKGWWAYPGNLQGRSTKATECGPKGALLVGIDESGRFCEPEFIPCDAMRFARCVVDISTVTDDATIPDMVNDRLIEIMQNSDDRPTFVRIELTGASPVSAALDVRWGDFVADLVEEATETLAPGAVVKVERSYRPGIDLKAERSRETLLGAVLREIDDEPDLATSDELRNMVEQTLAKALGSDR